MPFTDSCGNEVAAQAVVDQLIDCGLLERLEELGSNQVRFANDPVAELLYAKAVIDVGGVGLNRLRRELKKHGEDVSGLRDALAQVEG